MGFFLTFLFLTFFIWIGCHITGALLGSVIWLFVLVPVSVILWTIALACCCTVLLIPLGIWLFKLGLKILIPCIS